MRRDGEREGGREGGTYFVIPLVDVLVHHGEDGVHLAEGFHNGCAVRRFLCVPRYVIRMAVEV